MVVLANKVTIANKLQLLEEEVANKLQRNKEGGNMLLCNKLLPNKLLPNKLQGNKEWANKLQGNKEGGNLGLQEAMLVIEVMVVV